MRVATKRRPGSSGQTRRELVWTLVVIGSLAGALLALLTVPVAAAPFLAIPTLVYGASRCPRDAVTVLTVFVVLVFVIPSGFVVGPLGAAGRPSLLVGVVALWWWAHARLLPAGGVARGLQPVRATAVVFAAAVVASYAAAAVRPLQGVESRAADRGLLLVAGLLGLLVLAADGISTRERLDTLLRRLATGGAVLGAVGLVQFITGLDLARLLHFPLLSELHGFQDIQTRSDLRRVAATASHPIEFGVVLGLLFPLALHYALHARARSTAAWVRVALIGLAIPVSVSRSGTIVLAITGTMMWFTWPARLRLRAIVITTVAAVFMRALVPGLLGTIKSLFTNILVDDSTKGRTEDYAVVGDYILDRPIFGRGLFTFVPDLYVLLDNQYLALIIETGIVGTVAFSAVLLSGFAAARGARRGADVVTRSLGQALAGSCVSLVVVAGTFDLLSFPMAAGIGFVLIGCSGALWRLQAPHRALATTGSLLTGGNPASLHGSTG
jgi:polysaccharide biosynthesis protein PslJ